MAIRVRYVTWESTQHGTAIPRGLAVVKVELCVDDVFGGYLCDWAFMSVDTKGPFQNLNLLF